MAKTGYTREELYQREMNRNRKALQKALDAPPSATVDEMIQAVATLRADLRSALYVLGKANGPLVERLAMGLAALLSDPVQRSTAQDALDNYIACVDAAKQLGHKHWMPSDNAATTGDSPVNGVVRDSEVPL